MMTVQGAHNRAICYTSALESSAEIQIQALCDQVAFAQCKIRIMPDVHAGMGCTIGTTMTITDKIVPGMVGVDIGCGMETVELLETTLDLAALDGFIRREIPCGRGIRNTSHPYHEEIDLTALRCARYVNLGRAKRSIGTLGGGNHFIEVDRGEDDKLYLVVHSGSRHIGNEVAKYYQDIAYKTLCGNSQLDIETTIAHLKAEGRDKEIEKMVKDMKKEKAVYIGVPKDLAYVEGALFADYIHDMKLIQQYATLNRKAMVEVLLTGMGLHEAARFTTIHNYIDTETMILRKGAVSAGAGERLLIPINMRDGSLICQGRGNDDWNQSAPHGAGRLMSRREAFARLSMEEYTTQMQGIYSSCVVKDTLDESPMAYKSMEEILEHIKPTAEVLHHIKPIYNFKATE